MLWSVMFFALSFTCADAENTGLMLRAEELGDIDHPGLVPGANPVISQLPSQTISNGRRIWDVIINTAGKIMDGR